MICTVCPGFCRALLLAGVLIEADSGVLHSVDGRGRDVVDAGATLLFLVLAVQPDEVLLCVTGHLQSRARERNRSSSQITVQLMQCLPTLSARLWKHGSGCVCLLAVAGSRVVVEGKCVTS